MRVVLITDEFAPYTGKSEKGRALVDLFSALKRKHDEVTVVVPVADEEIPREHSFAKRLRGITTSSGGAEIKWNRFDGRTADGIEVHLLAPTTAPSDFSSAFAQAARELIESGTDGFDARVLAGPALAEAAGPKPPRITLLSEPPASGSKPASTDAAIALAWSGAGISFGDVELYLLPGWASSKLDDLASKRAAKASLQSSFGLPVRPDVPMIFIPSGQAEAIIGLLTSSLRQDIHAVVATDDDEPLASLAEKYPDRLAVIPRGTGARATLFAADIALCIDEPRDAVEAMASGAVPVCAPKTAGVVVDLEPSLESGAGFVAQDELPSSIDAAIRRAIAAWQDMEAFASLQARIPGYTKTVDEVAEDLSAIIHRTAD